MGEGSWFMPGKRQVVKIKAFLLLASYKFCDYSFFNKYTIGTKLRSNINCKVIIAHKILPGILSLLFIKTQ
jgi:hypothetical protein